MNENKNEIATNIGAVNQTERCQRREIAIRNNPGIYKVVRLDKSTMKWIDSGKFMSTRRNMVDGKSRREKAAFSNLAE